MHALMNKQTPQSSAKQKKNWFKLRGYKNSQNNNFPMTIQKVPLCMLRLVCAVLQVQVGLMGPFLLLKPYIYNDLHIRMTFLSQQCNVLQNSMHCLHNFFGDGRWLWSDLLDINPGNFYLYGMLNDKAIGSNDLHNEDSLKESIQNSF
jgi:hypothetical protein